MNKKIVYNVGNNKKVKPGILFTFSFLLSKFPRFSWRRHKWLASAIIISIYIILERAGCSANGRRRRSYWTQWWGNAGMVKHTEGRPQLVLWLFGWFGCPGGEADHCFLRIAEVNPLNPELNPISYLLASLGTHHFLHVSRIRVKLLTLRRLMSYIYGAPILDVSRSHTTTQHSR